MADEVHRPELTDDARKAFYAAEGRWSAVVGDLGPRRVDALRVLRALRCNTPAELLQMVREGRPIIDGALVEVERVEAMLTEVGAEVAIFRVSE